MKKAIPTMIRVLILFMSLATLTMALFWTQNLISYAKELSNGAIAESLISVFAYILSSAITLVSLAVFAISLNFPTAIEKDAIFTVKTAKVLKVIACLVFTDCLLLALGTAIMFTLGDALISPVLAFVDVIGVAVSATLFLLSKYVRDASILKEEADYTL